ncbi:MAG: HTH domain-containing protein, partial [Deltaproteobacteria bacterium]|nr:HTH domain-containing protein [Deltaproteobacteria bacterium]
MSTEVGILKALLKVDRPLSGQALARQLGLSRTAVWKGMDRLRGQGLEIEAVRGRGYRLKNRTGPLGPGLIEACLTTRRLGRPVHFFQETDSTNLRAKSLALEGAPSGTLVLAEFQTRGRGRLDRGWLSPPGANLLLSLILRPDLELKSFFRLTMAA